MGVIQKSAVWVVFLTYMAGSRLALLGLAAGGGVVLVGIFYNRRLTLRFFLISLLVCAVYVDILCNMLYN